MGAQQFERYQAGKNSDDAFRRARESVQWEYGHGGYTGTIAEKSGYKLFLLPAGMTLKEFKNSYAKYEAAKWSFEHPEKDDFMESIFKVADDKWGPAACVRVPDEELGDVTKQALMGENFYYFFGWASS